MAQATYDYCVVGGGIVGLATDREGGNLRLAADLNFSFHRAIAKASGNGFHQAAVELLPNAIGHVGYEFRIGTSDEEHDRSHVILAEHRAILAAIRGSNAPLASSLMVDHISSAQRYLYNNLPLSFGPRDSIASP